MRRQCQLLGLAPASYYYQAAPEAAENLANMRWLDREYTERPCYVVRKLTQALQLLGPAVGPKRVRRLLRLMSLLAI